MQKNAEVLALIEQLAATDEKLEELLEGQVDSVTDQQGRVLLLRRAQHLLRQNEAATQLALLDVLPGHIALLDIRGVVMKVNKGWRHFAEANELTSMDHAVGLNYLEICDNTRDGDSDLAQQVAAGIRSVLSGQAREFSIEYPCHSPQEERWFVCRVAPLADDPPNGALVMHDNVTARRRAAEALAQLSLQVQRREQMFSTMLASISDFAYIYDRQGRLLFANQPMLDRLGLRLEEVVGKNHAELGYAAPVAERLLDEIQQVFATRQSRSFELPHATPALPDGYYEYVYSPALAANGSVDYVVGITRNITERKRNQIALRKLNSELESRVQIRTAALSRQEALFHALADHAPAIIWTSNAETTQISYINAAGASLLGVDANALVGKTLEPYIHPDDLPAMRLEKERSLQSCTTFESVHRLRAADGSYRTMSCRSSPVLLPDGNIDFWVSLEMDITELKEVENALLLSNRDLESFAYSIAHDLRSPLTVMVGFGQLLQKELGAGATPRAMHLLARMRAGVKQMDEVSAGLLALGVVSRGAIKLETTNLSQMAREVADLLHDRNPERQVRVNIQDGMTALCDRSMLRSLIANLIGNAWKFTSKIESAEISFYAAAPGPGVNRPTRYCVQDNGAGFDMTYADKLFVPFQRLHSVEEFEGTGIGLATVHKIVERHGGSISASGEPGKGALMTFTLGA